jgi:hypothetical protein
MSDHAFTAEAIEAIAAEIKAKKYQASAEAKAALFERIYREPENRVLVSDNPAMPIVASSMLLGDDEAFELMEVCAEHIPPGMKPIDFFVLAGLAQFDDEDALPFAQLIRDDEIAARAALGQDMRTTVTVTFDGIEDSADEFAENPFFLE